MAMDPVCGMNVDEAAPKGGTFIHQGRTFYFCSAYCREHFAASPRQYLESSPLQEAEADPEAIYTCPMDPQVEQKGPGTCPLCGMALEPKDPLAGDNRLALSDAFRRFALSAALAAPLALLVMGQHLFSLGGAWMHSPAWAWLQLLLALPVVLWGGAPIFAKAWTSLATRHLNMYTLIGLGTGTALAYSLAAVLAPGLFPPAFWSVDHGMRTLPLYFESAAVIVALVLMGDWLELKARSRTGSALKALLDLQARTARRLGEGGAEEDVDLALVRVGDRLRVRPGEAVPVDGRVLEGSSWVDESRISGESAPVAKTPGDTLIGATLNGQGGLVMRAERVGKDSLLSRIVAQVAEAQRSRAPIQRLADRAAALFVPAVVAVAVLSFAAWALWGPEPRLAYGLLNAVAVLMVACPCALGLATPMSIMVGMGRSAQLGVLFRDAEALEILGKVDVLCVDKTGTLTEGRPRLVALLPAPGITESGLLSLAASLEAPSEHPIGHALLTAAKERGLALEPATGFEALPGQGVQGQVGGQEARVGSAAFCQAAGPALLAKAEELAGQAATVVWASREGRLLGLLAVADPIRASTPEALARLKAQSLRVVMLSGDAPATAQAVARQLGLEEAQGGLSPLDKAEAVRALQAQGLKVAMAGDGVNDAPALAAAQVGIAMGTGTDVAKLSAGVVLIQADLRSLGRAVAVSRSVLGNIRQNLFWAMGYNALGVPIAAGVLYPFTGALLSPMFAAAAMSLSSVSVVGNALRLRRMKG
jgi:Cu+-exporting ATPase